MQNFADLHLKPQVLARYGLPDIAYPVPVGALHPAAAEDGELPLGLLPYGLQQRCRDGGSDWHQFEVGMDRLAALLAPDHDRLVVPAAGDNWWLQVGPVDLNGKLVTIQRGDELIAAIGSREDGRLRVAVFRPLDAKSAEYLIGLGRIPHPEYGVCMRENNWEYALDCSAGNGNFYAADRGEAYLSYWEKGIGINWDGAENPAWRPYMDLAPRRASVAAAELGVYFTFAAEAGVESADQSEQTEEPALASPPAWSRKRQQRRTVQGRFLGCLLGGAVGDALGAPVEFMKRTDILRHFGPEGITTYAPAYGGIGTITDDTRMTYSPPRG